MVAARLFLSCVSAEFLPYRDLLRRDLDRPNVTVKVQEDFIATGTETLDKLDGYVRQCDAVVHLVGDMTGALAQPESVKVIRQRYPDFAERFPSLQPFLAPGGPALSYTQWEAWLALYHGKMLLVAVPLDNAARTDRYRFDLEQKTAQQQHLKRLEGFERYPEIRFESADRLSVAVLRSGLNEILRAVEARSAVFQAPPMPDRFVGRAETLAKLKGLIRPADDEGGRITRILLHGLPGVGKSILAKALAHDEEIRKRYFPDGVLWVELGQVSTEARDTVLIQRLNDCGRALNDPELGAAGYANATVGAQRLAALLADRACLLVLDDAWRSEHVRPFLGVGGRSLLFVTSRKTEIATDFGMETIRLDEMSPDGALQLMAAWTGPIAPGDLATARLLATEVGHLPLALELIGARVRELSSWSSYQERWRRHRLAAVNRRRGAKGPQHDLRDSIALSVDELSKEDREAYLQFAVFAEDTEFSAGAVAALLAIDVDEATDLLVDLAGKALVTKRGAGAELRCRLHDVLHEYVLEMLGDVSVKSAHRRLLDGYRRACGGAWHNADYDGYYHDHIAYHMDKAQAFDELKQLIDLNWLHARYRHGGFDHKGFLDDLSVVLEAARLRAGEDGTTLARIQGARMVVSEDVSINRPADLAALVYLGRAREAVAKARLDPWGLERFRNLAAVTVALHASGEPVDSQLQELEQLRLGMGRGGDPAEAAETLVEVLLRVNRPDQAAALCGSLSARYQNRARHNAVRVLAALGQPQAALEWAQPATETERCVELALVAGAYAKADKSRAEALIQEAGDLLASVSEDTRGWCLEELATAMFRVHAFEAGFEACLAIPHDERYRWALPLVAAASEYALASDFEMALALAEKLDDQHALAVRFLCSSLEKAAGRSASSERVELLRAADLLPWNERDALMRKLLKLELLADAADVALRATEFSEATSEVAEALARRKLPSAEAILEHALELSRENRQASEISLADSLGPIAARLSALHDARAERIWDYLERRARAAARAQWRAWALLPLAETMLASNPKRAQDLLDAALGEARQEPDDNFKWQAIGSAVNTCLHLGRLEDALGLIAIQPLSVEDEAVSGMRDDAIGAVAEQLAVLGRFDEAKSWLTKMGEGQRLARTQFRIGHELAKAGQVEAAMPLLSSMISKPQGQLVGVLLTLIQAGAVAQAESLVVALPVSRQLSAWRSVATKLAESKDDKARGYLSRALDLADDLPTDQHGPSLANLVKAVAMIVGREDALARARSIGSSLWRATALMHVVEAEPDAKGNSALVDEAVLLTQEPLPAREGRIDASQVERALVTIIDALVNVGRIDDARGLLAAGGPRASGVRPTESLIAAFAQRGRFDEANALADQVSSESPNHDPGKVAAEATYRRGQVLEAVRLLRPRTLDGYLETLCDWTRREEGAQSVTTLNLFEAALEVARWKRPDWQEVHRLLATPD